MVVVVVVVVVGSFSLLQRLVRQKHVRILDKEHVRKGSRFSR